MYLPLDFSVSTGMRFACKGMVPFLFLCTALYLGPPSAVAQTAGTIRYQRTVKPEIPPALREEVQEDILASMSAVDTTAWRLHFTEKASVMMEAPNSATMPGRSLSVSSALQDLLAGMAHSYYAASAQGYAVTYTDLEAWTVIEQKDFLGRAFLIQGDRPEYVWRITGQQGEYLGFACQQAVTEVDSARVDAWFAPELPVSVGPVWFGGLPGAILLLSIDDGSLTTYSATHVLPEAPGQISIWAPEQGKAVTKEEFDAMVKEKMEEVQKRSKRRWFF